MIKVILIALGACLSPVVLQAFIEHESTVYCRQELINNTRFTSKLIAQQGNIAVSYLVNTNPVPQEEYEKLLAQAEIAERRQVMQSRIREREVQYKLRAKIAQQELKPLLLTAEAELVKLVDPRMKPYIAYSPATIAGAQELTLIAQEQLPQIRKLVDMAPDMLDYEQITRASSQLNQLVPKLKELFSASVSNAIAKETDTRVLKALLELV